MGGGGERALPSSHYPLRAALRPGETPLDFRPLEATGSPPPTRRRGSAGLLNCVHLALPVESDLSGKAPQARGDLVPTPA